MHQTTVTDVRLLLLHLHLLLFRLHLLPGIFDSLGDIFDSLSDYSPQSVAWSADQRKYLPATFFLLGRPRLALAASPLPLQLGFRLLPVAASLILREPEGLLSPIVSRFAPAFASFLWIFQIETFMESTDVEP